VKRLIVSIAARIVGQLEQQIASNVDALGDEWEPRQRCAVYCVGHQGSVGDDLPGKRGRLNQSSGIDVAVRGGWYHRPPSSISRFLVRLGRSVYGAGGYSEGQSPFLCLTGRRIHDNR